MPFGGDTSQILQLDKEEGREVRGGGNARMEEEDQKDSKR